MQYINVESSPLTFLLVDVWDYREIFKLHVGNNNKLGREWVSVQAFDYSGYY